jgi:ubiquinone/menaquinone biosynthesis C-methylase UbiE
MPTNIDEIQAQRAYYAQTAAQYDAMHVSDRDEHSFSLALLLGLLEHFDIRSVLDVGSGTGRAVKWLKARRPDLRVVGVEPVAALREIGHKGGLSESELMDGDATKLPFKDGEFDLVAEFAVLHHIKDPSIPMKEMLRVARKAILISDSNNLGQGGTLIRFIKQSLHAVNLWKAADWVRTRGKGYHVSQEDGVFYSYTVFDHYPLLRQHCDTIHLVNTSGTGTNHKRQAPHVALLAIKRNPATA